MDELLGQYTLINARLIDYYDQGKIDFDKLLDALDENASNFARVLQEVKQ